MSEVKNGEDLVEKGVEIVKAVAAIVVDKQTKKILLVRRNEGPFFLSWAVVTGERLRKEQPKTAIVREVKEELDIQIRKSILRYVGVFHDIVSLGQSRFHVKLKCYMAKIDLANTSLRANPSEIIETKLIHIKEISRFDTTPVVRQMISRLARGGLL